MKNNNLSFLKSVVLIFLILMGALLYVANMSPYPRNSGEWFIISYYVSGSLECFMPTPTSGSSVDIDLVKNEIRIRDISVTKKCDFEEGYLDIKITDIIEKPVVYGINKSLYFIKEEGEEGFRIYFNSSLMKDRRYSFSIKLKIEDKFNTFYPIYEVLSNTKPWAILFYYPTSLIDGYSCEECFSLLEGNLRRVHQEEKIFETGVYGNREFFFKDEEEIIIKFNPRSKLNETLKNFFFGLIISIMAGLITFFIQELIKNKKFNSKKV